MIFSYAQNEIRILSGDIDAGSVRAVRVKDNQVREYQLFEIYADGGLSEIAAAIEAVSAKSDKQAWIPG